MGKKYMSQNSCCDALLWRINIQCSCVSFLYDPCIDLTSKSHNYTLGSFREKYYTEKKLKLVINQTKSVKPLRVKPLTFLSNKALP